MTTEPRSARMEAKQGALHVADAERSFIDAIQDTKGLGLPAEAFQELARHQQEQISQWASKWSVHAPCVLSVAKCWCNGGWKIGRRISVWIGPSPPVEWASELAEFDNLRVDSGRWNLLAFDDVVSEGEQQRTVKKDQKQKPTSRGNVDEVRSLSDGPRGFRKSLLSQERMLAPLAADPLLESCEAFLRRAKRHWQARAERAKSMGYDSASHRQESNEHLAWLLRNQLKGDSISSIARSVGRQRQTVAEAIKNLRTMLELKPPEPRTVPRRK